MGNWSYGYDALGNLTSQTDARSCVLTLGYDLLSRLTSKSSSAAQCNTQVNTTYTYDVGTNGLGRRTGMTDDSGSTSWIYDTRGRMMAETKTITGISYTTLSSYNSADQVSSTMYPDGEIVTNTYDARMLLNSVTAGVNTYVQSTTYDSAQRIDIRTYGNTIRTDYDYYAYDTQGGLLKSIKSGTPTDPTSLQSLEYAYDAVGNVDWIKDWKTANPQLQDFGYDALNRLTSASASGGTNGVYTQESYTYDTEGNLDLKAGVNLDYTDTLHKHAVTKINSVQKYWYDADGNQTQRILGADTFDLTYDAENRLVEVKKNSAVLASFKYDGDGKRVQSTFNGVTTRYYGLVEMDNHAVQSPPPGFTDVLTGNWAKPEIDGLYNLGILSACATNPLRYCPTNTVTRIDEVHDILRAKYGASYVPPAPSHYFADMAGNPLEAWADEAYREGITAGCSSNPLNFCPSSSATNFDIVIFLLRARYGGSYTPPAASHYFADMNANSAEAWADEAYREGITNGCSSNPLNFCPSAVITRDTLAVMLERTFHLIPYSGTWHKYYFAGASRVAMRTCAGSGAGNCAQPVFFLSDHLGSTSVVVSSTGSLLMNTLYKPWGEVRYATASQTSPTRYTYTGQDSYMNDDATDLGSAGFGLMFYNARWYDPYITQFSQPDSIVPNPYNSQDWNRYAYARYNPIRYVDPSGHESKSNSCDYYGGYYCGPVALSGRAQQLIHFARSVDRTPEDVIAIGLSHEMMYETDDQVAIHEQLFSTRFVDYARNNCGGNQTSACMLNYFAGSYESVYNQFLSKESGYTERTTFWGDSTGYTSSQVTNLGTGQNRKNVDSAETFMKDFMKSVPTSYDPLNNKEDAKLPYDSGVYAAADISKLVQRNPAVQSGFLIVKSVTCPNSGEAGYSIIMDWNGALAIQKASLPLC